MEVNDMNLILQDNFFDRFFDSFPRLESRRPNVDIGEDEKSFVLKVDLPGAKKENVSVKVENDFLTISSEIKKEDKLSKGSNIYEERFQGRYDRSFKIPNTINVDGIDSRLEDGVLTLNLPKKESAKKPKPIDIEVS
jgi:HSP20 family protein